MEKHEVSSVSEWRDETAADIADAQKRIEALLGSMAGEPSSEQVGSVWMAYVKVEKSVAFIKFDLDEENPWQVHQARRATLSPTRDRPSNSP